MKAKWTLFVFIALASAAYSVTGSAALHETSAFWLGNYDPATAQYSDVKKFLTDLAAQNPTTTRLVTVGDSDSGDTILGVAIGNGPVKNMVVSTHHGNEYGSTEVARAFAESIAQKPVDGQTVFVIPVLNVTGYNEKNRYEAFQQSSQDPNRDYPGPCGTEGPHKLKSTAALARFIDEQGIVASATLHTYYPAVVYPWGLATQDLSTPYDDLFKMLTTAATEISHYATGNSTEVIYAANGTYEDYAFWKHGIWSLLFELGDTHTPTNNQIAEMIRTNVPGLRNMMEKAPAARATNHDFTGHCDSSMLRFDRHDE